VSEAQEMRLAVLRALVILETSGLWGLKGRLY
jgi:hypothetical protein